MSSTELKSSITEMIQNTNDEKILKIIYSFLTEFTEDDDDLTDAEKKILNEREERYLRGEAKTFSWEETKKLIRSKR